MLAVQSAWRAAHVGNDAKEQQKAGERTKKKSIGELVSEAEGHSVLSSPFGQVRTAVGEL